MKTSTKVKIGVGALAAVLLYKTYKKLTEKPFDPEAMYDYEDDPNMSLDDVDYDDEEDITLA